MPIAIRTPRVNNNDDVVKLSHVYVERGAKIRSGDPLAEVETDKATFTVESEHDGWVLAVNGAPGEMIAVGSVLAWLGDAPDERIEESGPAVAAAEGERRAPTLKALLLLKHYGLNADDIPASGTQLTAEDVRRFAAGRRPKGEAARKPEDSGPEMPGRAEPLTPEQRGMLRTVAWQRDHAVPGYVEIEHDPAAWSAHAAAFKAAHGLWFDPAVSLMAWRLGQIAGRYPRVNATVAGTSAHLYDDVNLGFTMQAEEALYLVVVKAAQRLDAPAFVRELGALQLAAMRRSLTPEQTSGATISFSSMARWEVARHMPVLPPHTALIVAHAAANGTARLGATYDHRLLTGYDAVRVLRELTKPPAES